MFKGIEYPLASPNPLDQHNSLERLKEALRERTRETNFREPAGSSKVMVLVRGDRTAKWKYIQWIMQVCADPTIKIWQIHFAVEHPKEQ